MRFILVRATAFLGLIVCSPLQDFRELDLELTDTLKQDPVETERPCRDDIFFTVIDENALFVP
jgi:hypothetical protein